MLRQLVSNFDNQEFFLEKGNPLCSLCPQDYWPLEQFISCCIPVRTFSGNMVKMVFIEHILLSASEDKEENGPDAVDVCLRVVSFSSKLRQCFVNMYFGSHSFQLRTFVEQRNRGQQHKPELVIFLSDLLRAKEIQQQSIMAWIMSARIAPLLIPRAATAKKRNFQELQQTSVYKWVAHPLMDRNLIRLVLSFVR